MADEAIVCMTEQIYSGTGAMSTKWDIFMLQVVFVDKRRTRRRPGLIEDGRLKFED